MPGIRQRLSAAVQIENDRPRGGESDVKTQSPFYLELLHMWTMGNLSAIGVQKLASAAVLEGLQNDRVAELAALGCWGQHPSNIHKELVALLSKDLKLAEPLIVPCKCVNSKEVPPLIESNFPVLPPHLLFHSMQQHYPDVFDSFFGVEQIRSFWDSIYPDDCRLQHNVVTTIPNYRDLFIPLWLHGDGVEFSADSLLAFSVGSLLVSGSSLDASALIAACPKHATASKKTHGADTWDLPFDVMVWSFQALFEGKHPHTDWNGAAFAPGHPLAELAGKNIFGQGFRCLVWTLLGDLEYFANTLGYPHWQNHEFCWLCNASKIDASRNWLDFTLEPGWQLKSADAHQACPSTQHKLVNGLPGVLPGFLPAIDILHCLDQGVSLRLAGGSLHFWVFDGPSSEAQAKLQSIWVEIRAAYDTLGTREKLTNLYLSMFTNIKYPFASPPVLKCKAAECRHLIPALAIVARARLKPEDAMSVHIAAALERLATFYLTLHGSKNMVLDIETAATARQALKNLLLHCSWLNHHGDMGTCNRFHIVPKFHFASHLADSCLFLNPAKSWTYKNEDWVGQLAIIALSCAHGTASHKLPLTLMSKYRLMLHLRLKHQIHTD